MAAQVWRIFSGFPAWALSWHSDAEIPLLDVAGSCELRGGPGPHHLTLLDDVVAVGNSGERLDVLVDEQDREPGGLEAGKAAPDLGAYQRCQAFGRLVENEQLR